MSRLSVSIVTPIGSVNMVDGARGLPAAEENSRKRAKELEESKARLAAAAQALRQAADALNRLHEEVVAAQREPIVRLSVGIAEKILHRRIEAGQYDIVKIVQEALSVAPAQQSIVLRLHPADMEAFQKAMGGAGSEAFSNIELIPDGQIGRAECVIETGRGIIDSMVDEHLRQIEEQLTAR